MINKVLVSDEIIYSEFRYFLGNKIHPTLYDTYAKTGKQMNFVKASYAWDNWSVIKDKNDKLEYFLMHDILFQSIIYDDLIERASKDYPQHFEKNDPKKVLEALSLTIGLNHDSSKVDYYRQTSYVAITNHQKDKVLYLGLFREINENENEFNSGYLHCLKHFCGSEKQPITAKSEPKILPENFIEHIIRCLFENEPAKVGAVKNIDGDKFMTYNYVLGGKNYNFKFYYSRKFDIYFLSTIHIREKSKK